MVVEHICKAAHGRPTPDQRQNVRKSIKINHCVWLGSSDRKKSRGLKEKFPFLISGKVNLCPGGG